MPDTSAGPALYGLRLGFPALDLATAVFEQVLGLTPIPVTPATAPGRPRRHHYAMHGLRIEARAQAAAPGLHASADVRCEAADALQWRHADLCRQRRHLQRLGLDVLNGADLGCRPCLRLESVDTGACAVEWRDPVHVAAALAPAVAVAGPRLAAIDLRVRAPESVASHWARLLSVPLGRDVDGVPLLDVDPMPIRFVPISAFQGAGIAALAVADVDAGPIAQRAAAHGLRVGSDASFSVGGLRIRQAAC